MDIEKKYNSEIKKLGLHLRKIRESKNLSQLDLELNTGINRTEISRIENGLKNIEFFTLIKLSDGLNVDISELFSR